MVKTLMLNEKDHKKIEELTNMIKEHFGVKLPKAAFIRYLIYYAEENFDEVLKFLRNKLSGK